MKYYDDDHLERALFALELEEPPVGLRQAILAQTVHPVPPVTTVRPWEVWVYGALCAVLVWMLILVLQGGATHVVTQAAAYGDRIAAFFSRPADLFWIALGAAATVWISQLNLTVTPGYQRAARR